MAWHFRGSPHYLNAQGDRLGISRILTDRARYNEELKRVSTILGQLCERWQRAGKNGDGLPVIFPTEMAQIRGALSQCEQELEKLHALAGAAQAMIDEAHVAFGLDPPERHMRVQCDFDEAPEPAALAIPPHGVTPSNSKAKAV